MKAHTLPIILLAVAAIAGCISNENSTASGHVKEFYIDSFSGFDGQPPMPFGNRTFDNRTFNRSQFEMNGSSNRPFGNGSFNRSDFGNRTFQMRPQFSLKEITADIGDTVVIYVNTTSGIHDFNIDEFGVHVATPTGEITKVQFTVDKAGEFVYYCSMPGHREAGQWGTLKVLDSGDLK